MRTFLRTQLLGLSLVACVACGSEDGGNPTGTALSDGEGGCAGIDNCINLDITEDTTLTAGTWTLAPKNNGTPSFVVVRNGATLTIEPGTTILGETGSALIVPRGSKIMAVGTTAAPIVFTSERLDGERAGGDWGGVLLLGAAPVNEASPQFEALPPSDPDGAYGGTDADDNSGVLRYVRIEFAGYAYAENKEFNGLTLCGVGRGTEIDFLQLHHGSDDGIEFFGGTVDVKHVLSTQNEDDGIDTDLGWSGRAQFVVVQHINGKSSDPNGYESDNRPEGGNYDATPRTEPLIYNATLIGSPTTPSASRGAVLRRGTSGAYWNHIFVDFKSSAIDVRDAATVAGFPSILSIHSSVFFNNGVGGANWQNEDGSANNDGGFVEATELLSVAFSNGSSDPGLSAAASDANAPDFTTAALLPGATPPADGFFDTSATFIGAVGVTDWTAGWTAYPQN